MIITHTISADGRQRVYLGGTGSLECWIEPNDTEGWQFRLDEAVTGNQMSEHDHRAYAIDVLLRLSRELNVNPLDLSSVPFHTIAALHVEDPFLDRRQTMSKRERANHGFSPITRQAQSTHQAQSARPHTSRRCNQR